MLEFLSNLAAEVQIQNNITSPPLCTSRLISQKPTKNVTKIVKSTK